MGGSSVKKQSIIQYVGPEEVKGETRVFRSAETKDGPLSGKIFGKYDTLLNAFEYYANFKIIGQ